MTPPAAIPPAPAGSPAILSARSVSFANATSRARPALGVTVVRPVSYRLLLIAGMAVIAAIVAIATQSVAGGAVDASFVRMMRVMAMIKAVLVAIAAAVLWWRLARPVTAFFATGYVLGAWLMVAATVLIWQLSSIGVAAVVFHTGELSLLFLAWRDTRS